MSQNPNLPRNADEQIAMLRQALTRNAECGTTHYNLAVALLGKQEFAEAEKELHEAIDCSPTLAEAYVQLGGICLQRNDLEGCYRYNQRATKVRAGFAEGYGNMAFVLLQLIDGKDEKADEEKLEKAIKFLRKAITHNKFYIQAYTTLGTAYFMKGLIDEAIKANLEALEVAPEFPVAHNNLAVAYLEKEMFDKAIEHCDKAVAMGYQVAPELLSELAARRG